ncbi:MAG: response regulator [Candidatus Ozemobacteraceae bacterium]
MAEPLKILAIDDNQDNLISLKAVVSDALPGVVVITALNGRKGIEKALSEDPDVILLDIVMPEMDGFEVCRILKADYRLLSIPVVFLTALKTDRESRIKALEAGAEGFLGKPLDEPELIAQIRVMAKIKSMSLLQRRENERLEVLVASRTHELEQELAARKQADIEREKLQAQLNHAQKMESVGQLAGGVAHDFNNMLGVILGYTEVVLEQLGPDHPLFGKIKEIEKAAHRSADLTGQLLAFARKQAVMPKVLDLNETVESILKMLRRLIGEHLALNWKPGAGLWRVKIDPGQINQILTNLAVNARDAIPEMGKITIETRNCSFDRADCATYPGSVPGLFVMLAVSDTGLGMEKEVLEHIFEPFFTTKEVGRGTGLGLATVYGIVKQNEGFIDVESRPDKGTIFRIYFPRYQGNVDEVKSEDDVSIVRGQGETVLVVEDETSMLSLIREILVGLDYKVLSADTPSRALKDVEAHVGDIHLLITDVVMPEMNGRELAARVREQIPGIKCFFMSGYTRDVIANLGVVNEGFQFIQKPFTVKDLAAKVRETLSQPAYRVIGS